MSTDPNLEPTSEKENSTSQDVKGFRVITTEIKSIFHPYFSIFTTTIIPVFVTFAILWLISSILRLLILDVTQISYNYSKFMEEFSALQELIANNPEYIPTEAESTILASGLYYQILYSLLTFYFPFFVLTGTYILLNDGFSRIFRGDVNEPGRMKSMEFWIQSYKQPFTTQKRALINIGFLLFAPIIIPISVFLFIIPVFLFLSNRFFIINTINDPENEKYPVKTAKYYGKEKFITISLIMIIIVFLPMFLSIILEFTVLPNIGLSRQNYFEWINPGSIQFGKIFLYHLGVMFVYSLLLIFFPGVYSSTYNYITENVEKYEEVMKERQQIRTNYAAIELESEKPIEIAIDINQQTYSCQNCGSSISIANRVCSQCGQEHMVRYKQ